MAENRYVDKDIHRRERHKLHKLDEETRQNEEIDARERRARQERRLRDENQRQLLVAQ